MDKAAQLGVPSLVWRAGQDRRFQMILDAAGDRISGFVFDNGCGIGQYVAHLTPLGGTVFGLEYDYEQIQQAKPRGDKLVQAAGENLPFPNESFDLILSHEVIEHVQDDRVAVREMVRTLKPGGRIVLFCPNRGYPVETHGVYWRGKYRFGNIPFVNWLPTPVRDRLAPHVRVYTARELGKLFEGLSIRVIQKTIIFGAYDNIIARFGRFGRIIRGVLQAMEKPHYGGLVYRTFGL